MRKWLLAMALLGACGGDDGTELDAGPVDAFMGTPDEGPVLGVHIRCTDDGVMFCRDGRGRDLTEFGWAPVCPSYDPEVDDAVRFVCPDQCRIFRPGGFVADREPVCEPTE